ncbi:hypothetical protein [Rhizobium paknamense]|uniref:Flagellar hook-length control protein FliK n=1 Tax=Rhizobium paknamense TaxID=1206817 RepID=A0ABU0IBF5_9HYPH|nr:hypothetical protein [Rhizobium paknamense]MDQ0455531.1 hypothetical protein [Rhizobium paknamense]
MLPPVQALSRTAVAFQEGQTDSLSTRSGLSGQPELNVRVEDEASASIAGRINMLMSGRGAFRADLLTIASLVGSSIGIERQQDETDAAFVQRFVTALESLSPDQRQALQTRLGDLLAGLQLQTLLDALAQPDGPEATLIAAYLEIRNADQQDLKAQSVLTSYSQNEIADGAEPMAANPARPAVPAPTGPATQPASETFAEPLAAQTPVSAPSAAPAPVTDGDAPLSQPVAANAVSLGSALSMVPAEGAASPVEDGVPMPSAASPASSATASPSPVYAPETDAASTAIARPAIPTPQPSSGSAVEETGIYTTQGAMPEALPDAADETRQPVAATATAVETRAPASALAGSAPQPSAAVKVPGDARALQTLLQQELALPVQDDLQQQPLVSAPYSKAPVEEVINLLALKGWAETPTLSPVALPLPAEEGEEALLKQMFFSPASAPAGTEPGQAVQLSQAELQKTAVPARQQADQGQDEGLSRSTLTGSALQQAISGLPQATVLPLPVPPAQAVPLPVVSYLAVQDDFASEEEEQDIDAIAALSDDEEGRGGNGSRRRDRQENAEDETEETALESEVSEADDAFLSTRALESAVGEDEAAVALPAPALALPMPAMDELSQPEKLYWRIADLA